MRLSLDPFYLEPQGVPELCVQADKGSSRRSTIGVMARAVEAPLLLAAESSRGHAEAAVESYHGKSLPPWGAAHPPAFFWSETEATFSNTVRLGKRHSSGRRCDLTCRTLPPRHGFPQQHFAFVGEKSLPPGGVSLFSRSPRARQGRETHPCPRRGDVPDGVVFRSAC